MALVSKSEAARLTGKSRTTIQTYVNKGELSANSGKKIDTSELIRVFGELVDPSKKTEQPKLVSGMSDVERQSLQDQISLLSKQLENSERREKELKEQIRSTERREELVRQELSEVNKLIRDTHKPRSLLEWFKG